jgi:hypothetical protein
LTFYGSHSIEKLNPEQAILKLSDKPTSIRVHPPKGYSEEDNYFYFALESKAGT